MTVQPEQNTGYVDYAGLASQVPMEQDPTTGAVWNDFASGTTEFDVASGSPTVLRLPNKFFMNGPRADPFNWAASQASVIDALTQAWSAPDKRNVLNNYSRLLAKYGNTNSPGTLWALASNNLDPETSAIQSLLATDAAATNAAYTQSAPALAGSPVMNPPEEGGGLLDNLWPDNMWAPLQTASRNVFGALSMPLEGIQGMMRGAGGALAEGDTGKAFAQFASFIAPPLSLVAEAAYGDSEFINPWEQTDFGQTILTATAGGKGWDAFFGQQAGLDIEKAKQELLQDPQYADLPSTIDGMAKLDFLATNLAREKGYYGGAGWFIDETSPIGESQRQQTFQAWAIPGKDGDLTAWTLGRGITSAVGGSDWAAYGAVSGLIDAVAAVFLDPLTYAGGIGVASKTAKVLSGGRILTGKAAKDVAAQQGAFNRSLAALSEKSGISVEELRGYELDKLAEVAKANEIAIHTTEAMTAAAANTDRVKKMAADVRRSLLTVGRVDRIPAAPTVPIVFDPDRASDAVSMLDELLATSFTFADDGTRTLDPDLYVDFLMRQPGGVETARMMMYRRQGVPESLWPVMAPQDTSRLQLFDDLNLMLHNKQANGEFAEMDKYDAIKTFRDQISAQGAPVERQPLIPVEQATAELERLVADPNFDVVRETIGKIESPGAFLSSFVPGQMSHSKVDGVEAISGWGGKSKPKIVEASSPMTVGQRAKVKKGLLSALDLDGMPALLPSKMPEDSVPGQVAKTLAETTELRNTLTMMLDSPLTTWKQIHKFAADNGLDGVLDDVMRSGRRDKVDGISGLLGKPGVGVWFGDHPSIVSYRTTATTLPDGTAGIGIDGITGLQYATPLAAQALRESSIRSARKGARDLGKYRDNAVIEAQRQQDALDDLIARTEDFYADPEKGLRRSLGWHAGLRFSRTGGYTVDERELRKFLFGGGPFTAMADRALTALHDFVPEAARKSANDSMEAYNEVLGKAAYSVRSIVGDAWDISTIKAVAENAVRGGGREGLLAVLAPRIGIDVTKGSISRTTRIVDGDGKGYLRTWRTMNPVIARALGNMPGGRNVDLSNAEDVVAQLMAYGRYAKVPEDRLAEHVGKVVIADGTMELIGTARNAFTGLFDDIRDTLMADFESSGLVKGLFRGESGATRKNEMLRAIAESTRLYLGGMTKEVKDNVAAYAENRGAKKYITSDNTEIEIPGIILTSQIAAGVINLPSVDEWSKVMKRTVTAISRYKFAETSYDIARSVFDNFFRTSMLVFRVSYVIRNLAEQQVRMFLNGHRSLIADPFTLAGMTIGNFQAARKLGKYSQKLDKARSDFRATFGRDPSLAEINGIVGEYKQSTLERLYAPYADTVLGTKFEVGKDDALALANHVDDYFGLVRMAHSLTDPRVYNSAVRQGWQTVAYGTPNFNAGWANELIMLNKDPIARLVAQYAGSTDDVIDAAVDMFRNSPKYANARAQLFSIDKGFRDILADAKGTREYMFDGEFSVASRIDDYTGGDPILRAFIESGLYDGNGARFRINSIPDPTKRVKALDDQLTKHFNDERWAQHFTERNVQVPWMERLERRQGEAFNWFFDWANKVERLGSVGPEFRQAYWDKIAELAPALRTDDVPRALKAARTTLGPLKRMLDDGTLDNFGRNHPAFTALKRQADSGDGGMLTLDDLHGIASKHAAKHVSELFYDATRRNNFWQATRLLFPFGQAWGNTIEMWTKLAAKQPINVYKAQKAFNALTEEGSSAVYEAGSQIGGPLSPYGQYAPGFAPWDQSTSGGFFYTDKFGSTSFMFPWLGRAAAGGINTWMALTGNDARVSDIPVQSPASSLNLALGADSIIPGVGPIVSTPLAMGLLPDSEITGQLRQLVAPFGDKDVTGTFIPAWLSKIIGGSGAFVDILAPANKNKHLRDAMAILATSGNYPNWATDDLQKRRMQDDAEGLAKALLFTTGLIQNVSPATPITSGALQTALPGTDGLEGNTALYTIGMLNTLFQQYRPRNGYDDTAAREEFIKDFGPAAIFASIGDWASLSRVPTSQALQFAYRHPKIAKANLDLFTLFFPQGDSSDVAATSWINKYGYGVKTRKTKEEMFDEATSYLERVQRFRIQSMEANGMLSEQEADEYLSEVRERYMETADIALVAVDRTREMGQLKKMVDEYAPIRDSQAGKAFQQAWMARDAALAEARSRTGRANATLGAKDTAAIYAWYVDQINKIADQYPDFKLLASKFRREWE